MKNPERAHYPALTQAEIRALYQACPTVPMRRLVWEIYCLHVVVKKACSVARCRNVGPTAMPGARDYPLGELPDMLQDEIYVHEHRLAALANLCARGVSRSESARSSCRQSTLERAPGQST